MIHKGTVQLGTERLILRRFTIDDAEDVFSNWSGSAENSRFVMKSPHSSVTETKKKPDWAVFMKSIAEQYKDADRITLVMDNYGTHNIGAFYEVFSPEEAKALIDRFEFIYTAKHGNWLNMAEIELNVLQKQCIKRRIPDIKH